MNLHATILLLLPGLAVLIAVVFGKRPTRRRLRWAAAAALGLLGGVLALPGHLCDRGSPLLQSLIPAAAASLTLVFVRDARAAVMTSLAMVLVLFALRSQYEVFVHRPDVVGNPAHTARLHRSQEQRLNALKDRLRASSDPVEHPATWVRDLPWAGTEWLDWDPVRLEIQELWHTRFTGLWRLKQTPLDAWYPGGTRAAAADRVELRPR